MSIFETLYNHGSLCYNQLFLQLGEILKLSLNICLPAVGDEIMAFSKEKD